MKTIAVFNNKGGIGKTTFTVHVALYAAKYRIRTLVVGLDRQGDVCRWLAGGDCEVQDGLHFRRGDYLQVIYSPMELPEKIANYELVIADCPPAIEVVDRLSADLWLVPLDGRMAMENLGNIYPSLKQTKGLITLVLNRCDLAGKRVVDGLREAAEQIPNAIVRGEPIPASAAIAKSAEYYRAVWDVPYGRGTQGDRAIQKLCVDVLSDCGFGGRLA